MSSASLRQWLLLTAVFQSASAPADSCDDAPMEAGFKARARELWRAYQDSSNDAAAFVAGLRDEDYPGAILRTVDACEAWCAAPGRQLLTRNDPDYPPLLATIPDPPPVLFIHGERTVLSRPQLAIVGSRKPTSAGSRLAQRFAGELVAAGYVVTSGLALGIDAASHEGALQAGGHTIAVLGTGLDRIYPARHAALADAIAAQGVLVSELLPQSGPLAWHFPRRNRLISGLAHGVLVVEAALSSGSLITARMAAEQGREIFAVPGPVTSPQSRGCHRLLRQGAVLVESIDDILAELGGLLQWERAQGDPVRAQDGDVPRGCDELDRNILAQIAYNPVAIDVLAAGLALDVARLLPRLLQLELAGLVECRAGCYVRSG